ncbi:MAG: hypothetical protein HKM04_06705 [Legionellales bacterium]|nr:hypothetical protein [Legionellales bacterium]
MSQDDTKAKKKIEKNQANDASKRKDTGESQDASRHEGDIAKHGDASQRRQEHKQHEKSHAPEKRVRIPNDFKPAPR